MFRALNTAGAILLLLALTACSPAAPPPPSTLPPSPPAPTLAPAVSPAASPAVSPVASPSAAPVERTSLQYGVMTFIWGHPETTQRDLHQAQSMQLQWQKSLFEWKLIEPQRGVFDWTEADRVVQASNAAGLQVLARLDFQPTWARADGLQTNGAPDNPQDFAAFVSAVATRYAPGSPHGTLGAIEVWNEPNLQREWGGPVSQQSATAYVKLLSAAYTAAKAANPQLIVSTAGLSPTGIDDDTARPDDTYLRWLYQAGMQQGVNYDVLGLHANIQAPDPLAALGSLPNFPHPSFYFKRIEQMRAIEVAAGQGSAPIWILEFGWTSDTVHPDYAWYAVSEEQKGRNIVTALHYALQNWQPWIGPMFIWTLPDPSWTRDREEYWWAIANPDGTPRPAELMIQQARSDGTLP